MLDPANVPDVDAGEMTARFVVSKRHINRQTGTLKADAFVPHPYEELSVTRLIQITDEEIWGVGHRVAAARMRRNLPFTTEPGCRGGPCRRKRESRQRHRLALSGR
jgi:hypothetical protein